MLSIFDVNEFGFLRSFDTLSEDVMKATYTMILPMSWEFFLIQALHSIFNIVFEVRIIIIIFSSDSILTEEYFGESNSNVITNEIIQYTRLNIKVLSNVSCLDKNV